MSKIVEHFLVPLFVVVSILYAFNSFGADNIELNKVFLHTTNDAMHLERATLSLYFSHEVHVEETKIKRSADSNSFYRFFIPNVVMTSHECEAMVNRVNSYSDDYRIAIKRVSTPSIGIEITITSSNNRLAVNYEKFDSIGLQKGLVFRLYNKDVLSQLERSNNQPVLRTLWYTGKPCIAIDPGHGGTDCGATGHGGIQEKYVCLAIGTAVGDLLQERGCDVILTRNNDCTVALDQRTTHAHKHHADLFVSIHANYAADNRARGVETFCVQPRLLQSVSSDLSDMQKDSVAQVMNQRAYFSDCLAQSVQRHTCDAIESYHNESIDRKVKYSVSQVLLGAQMPAVLIEVGFVSHPSEAALLGDTVYQGRIARGICDGILSAIAF